MLAKSPQVGVFGATSSGINTIKKELDDWLYTELEGVVQSGPFADMVLRHETSWSETRLAPMLLGCYEEELHGLIEQQVTRLKRWERPPNIVVVGCAEGYYAIGLKLRLPHAKVYALDSDDKALAIMKHTALDNDVEVIVGADLSEVFAAPDLIVMDCEGAEVTYLDHNKFPALVGAHIIVEVHNLEGQPTDEILLERFRGTHRIDMVFEGPRNPNKFKQLCGMTADYRWMAVSEDRPCLMSWYSMTPRGMTLS